MDLHNNISQEDWELLDDYLSGNMPRHELNAFRERLNNEPALREARLLITGIKESSLAEKLDLFHTGLAEKKIDGGNVRTITREQKIVKKLRLYWAVAAATVILVTAAAVFMLNRSDYSSLAAEYFEPDPGTATTMGTTDNYAFDRGMVDYKLGNYAEALQAWRPLLANNSNDTLHYFSGISFLALQKADSAAYHLRPVWNNSQSSFRPDAGWYLALALLQEGKKTEAISLLEQSNHPRKAELLLRIK